MRDSHNTQDAHIRLSVTTEPGGGPPRTGRAGLITHTWAGGQQLEQLLPSGGPTRTRTNSSAQLNSQTDTTETSTNARVLQ